MSSNERNSGLKFCRVTANHPTLLIKSFGTGLVDAHQPVYSPANYISFITFIILQIKRYENPWY